VVRRALALDLGSSSVRAIVFEAAGDGPPAEVEGGAARRPRQLNRAEPGQATFDADSYVSDLVACIDELHRRGVLAGVSDVGVGCQWHSVLPVGPAGEPLGEVISWADTRAAVGSAGKGGSRVLDEDRMEALRQRTGCAYAPLYWTYKVPWLMGRVSAARFVGLSEYVAHKLLGDAPMSVSMASGTGLLASEALDWDSEALELAGLSRAQLPPLGPEGWLGRLQPNWQKRWPDLAGAPWHPTLGDGAAANIGAGCDRPGRAAVTVGTSAAVRAVREAAERSRLPAGLWRYVVDHSRVVTGAAFSSGGQVYRWALSLWEHAGDPLFDVEMPVPAGSQGVGVLPWHSGSRPPATAVPAGEGVVFGLGLAHTGAHIVSAAAEAVCFELAGGLQALEAGTLLEVVAGGGALEGSPWWRQRLASALGRPVRYAAQAESTALGAACFALGSRVADPGGEVVQPLPGQVAALAEARERWERWRTAALPVAAGLV
jgi:gluconokinase